MSKINREEFISEMIKGYKEDRATALPPVEDNKKVETASTTADNIEDRLTAEPVEVIDDSSNNENTED